MRFKMDSNLFCIPECFNRKVLHHLYEKKTFVNTNSKSGLVLKNRFKTLI